jgi:beta-glucosidase
MNKTIPRLEDLSLSQKIGQMVMVRASGLTLDRQRAYPQWELSNHQLQELIEIYGISGIILVGGTVGEVYQRIQYWQSLSAIPLFMSADVEEGVGQRFSGGTVFPPPMALSDIYTKNPSLALTLAREMGKIIAEESLAIGLNWIFAPVADVNNNPANPVINVRSFGSDPQIVKNLITAFVKGAHTYPILTTAKHFPGHGDTVLDSHLHTPIIDKDQHSLYGVELYPFRGLIQDTQIDSIMTAHIIVKAFDPDHIATCSPVIIHNLLRQEMGFSGLVISDALIMGGVTGDPIQTAIQAILAGVDILLMPPDPQATIEGLISAVQTQIIPENIIDRSVSRILSAKAKSLKALSLRPSMDNLFNTIGSPTSLQISSAISENSCRYYVAINHDSQCDLTLDQLLNECLWLPCGDRLHASDITNPIDNQNRVISPQLLPYLSIENLPPICLEVFSRGNPFRGTAGWQTEVIEFVQRLVEAQKLALILLYGSPYNLEPLLKILTPTIPWGFAYSPLSRSILIEKIFAQRKTTVL